ncbi:hypothetical protein Fot_34770 [Forsythia ovata]|uniref:Uncharacterized protein n=1 Tax=Forsythia ovata TaxID=205694 RepID=A0ABD1SJM6_9LAMI
MARAKDNHAQQRYNHGGQVNVKPSDGGVGHQTGHHQGGYQFPFSGTGSNYAVEITEAIPNLHVRVNNQNQRVHAGEIFSSKSKKPFTDPYCAYHRFYGHKTEDCRDIQALAEQRT